MNNRLLYWSVTCALAGFIFGFDLSVTSGVEQKIQSLWSLSAGQHGFAMSAAFWGTVLGALLGGFPTERWGRRRTLLCIGIFYFVSAIGSALAPNVGVFTLARFLGGIGIGVSTVAAPLFISEISPADRRGRLTGMFQFNIVLGLLIATLSNFAIIKILGEGNEGAWRWMLGVEAFPALLYSVLCFKLPESPRWLIVQGRREEGKEVLRQINPRFDGEELEEKVAEIEESARLRPAEPGGIGSRLKLPILLAFLIAFFNQLSGINAILGFAPRIFGLTGIDTSASLFYASLITLTNLVFTFVGLWLIDRLGRRTLLYIGSFGYIISLGICAWAFHTYQAQFSNAAAAMDLKNNAAEVLSGEVALNGPAEFMERIPESVEAAEEFAEAEIVKAKEGSGTGGVIVLGCIIGFIAAHAVGQGAVIWVFISEIFPARARSFGQSLGSGTHWVFAALLTLFFPIAMAKLSPSVIFGFFCFMMVLQLVWVKLMVPETKGVSLEKMEENLGSGR